MTAIVVQPVLTFPNFVDSGYVNASAGYNPVVMSGGSWLVARPLTNMQNYFLNKTARSTNANESSTWFHVDLGVLRDIGGIIIPRGHNIERTGQVRVRSSTQVNWSGVTVNGVNNSGATSLSVSTTAAISVKAGDGFTIEGDSQVYQATNDVSIGASTTGSIGVTRVGSSGTGLAVATVGGEDVTCHAGNYTANTSLDTGYVDVWQVIYAFGTLPYGHPSLADGKATEEEVAEEPIPFAIYPGTYIDRYWRIDIKNTGNTDGYIDIGRLVMGRTYEPSLGMVYGSDLSWFSDTVVNKSLGGARIANAFKSGKRFTMGLKDIPEDEAMSQIFATIGRAGLDKQVFISFNKNDTVHKSRRSFLANLERVDNPIQFAYFNGCDVVFTFQEVIA